MVFFCKKEEKTLPDQTDDDQGRLSPFTAYFAERVSAVGSTALAGKILHQFFLAGWGRVPRKWQTFKSLPMSREILVYEYKLLFYEKFISKDLLCCFLFQLFFSAGISCHALIWVATKRKKMTEIWAFHSVTQKPAAAASVYVNR